LLIVQGVRFAPLSRFFHERNFALATEDLYARSLGLLIDYLFAREKDFSAVEDRGKLFNQFAHDLRFGTIRDGVDPTNLWWLPRRLQTVRQMLNAVLTVSDWLVEKHGATPLNPYRSASHDERIVFWRKWNAISAANLLAHLKHPKQKGSNGIRARQHPLPERSPRIVDERPPAFPEDLFGRLITRGLVRPGKQKSSKVWVTFNIRDILITLLLHGGGLRESEPFHIWVSDVFEDPSDASVAHVRVYHPSDGSIEVANSGRPVTMNRAAYLALHHGMEPLNRVHRRAGWKHNMVRRNGLYMPLFWRDPEYGRLFLKLFRLYIEHSRPASGLPWLFLTESGRPMNGKTFADMHKAAVIRAGLVPAKSLGTTPHGHRHAYGQWLEAARERGLISRKVIQTCMHHSSVLSQDTYTRSSLDAINQTLQQVLDKDDGCLARAAVRGVTQSFSLLG
jgi:integrase